MNNMLSKLHVVPGMMVSSLFGGLVGATLLGNGTILLSQSSNFRKPIFIDEVVTTKLEIINLRVDKQ